jgi:hypothetical protein
MSVAAEYQVVVEDHKGFSIRKCKKGFLAFKTRFQLATQPTVEDAIRSIDEHLEWERQWKLAKEREEAEREIRVANAAKLEAQRIAAVFACIQPVRDFVESHGLDMLKDCVRQLDAEERERNVPTNWEELVKIAERIGERRVDIESDWGTDQVGEVDVDKYGVIEHRNWNSDEDEYLRTTEYGLQEYIDEFSEDYLPQDEEESEEV